MESEFLDKLAYHDISLNIILRRVNQVTSDKVKEPSGESEADAKAAFVAQYFKLTFCDGFAVHVGHQRLHVQSHEANQEHLPLRDEGQIHTYEAPFEQVSFDGFDVCILVVCLLPTDRDKMRAIQIDFLEELVGALHEDSLVFAGEVPGDHRHSQVFPQLLHIRRQGCRPLDVEELLEDVEAEDGGEHELEALLLLGLGVVEGKRDRPVVHQALFLVRDGLVIKDHFCY